MVLAKTDYFLIILLNTLLITALITDVKSQKIPNLLTFPAAGLAVIYHIITGGSGGLVFSTAGLATGILLLITPYLMGGMGAGDAKLMGAIGAILGAKSIFSVFLFTAIAGGIYALLLVLFNPRQFKGFFKEKMIAIHNFILIRQYIPTPPELTKKRPKLCYGVAIVLGTYGYCLSDLYGFKLIF